MFYRIKTLILFLILLSQLTFLGCGKKLEGIEENIIFSIREGYQSYNTISEPKIFLFMATEKENHCCADSIVAEVSISGDTIFIELLGIYLPEVRPRAFGPATAISFLDIPNGDYTVYFFNNGQTDTYVLTVTDGYISISKKVSHFTIPEFTLFWRYPSNTFAYLCGTTTATTWICEDFLDTLLSRVNLQEFIFADSGEIPYPKASMGYYYDMPAKYFHYDNEDDFEEAGEILTTYTHNVINQYQGIGIQLINWKNKRYYSWLVED